jgi:hypothetical protein
MLLFLIVIAFLVSPGVLTALLSRKVKLRKAFAVSYTQVLVATAVFGILYAVLKRYGLVREGFQYRGDIGGPAGDFQATSCGGPEGTKCTLAPKGSNRLSSTLRYGACEKNSNKPGFTCYDSLDTYNATNWTEGKLVPEEKQPGYAERVEARKRIAAESAAAAAKVEAENAKKAAETQAKMKAALDTPTVKKILKNELSIMKRRPTYNEKKETEIMLFRTSLVNKKNNISGQAKKDYEEVVNALLLLKVPDDQAYLNQYLKSL